MTRARRTVGRIAFVGAGPGDPGLLTMRAAEALAGASVVITDPERPRGDGRSTSYWIPTRPRGDVWEFRSRG